MLHSRLRPLPRRQHRPTEAIPRPDFEEEDGIDDEDPEDVFSAFLPHLFPDDAPSFHGDPGQRLLYSSPLYGDLEIMVPSYPGQSEKRSEEIAAGLSGNNEIEEGRKLFAHFLWSAAMVVAEGIEKDATAAAIDGSQNNGIWTVKGDNVLELGAGAALPSLLAVLAGAATVVTTDHPSSPAFAGAIDYNITSNVPLDLRDRISAEPHEWGVLDTPFARANRGNFSRIIAADCLWMRSQHENLVKTMLWFLSDSGEEQQTSQSLSPETAIQDRPGRIWVVAGFHTGRAIVASFFETAVQLGLEVETIYERDLNSGATSTTDENGAQPVEEVRREWVPVREGEGPENRRRWCVISVLKRKSLERSA
ncbi:conserved hypothetical protein [Paecilomyces variotii No. 5]|uniref:Nicotinamide N-methyltransferase n=1 Tax=Byssochlamys spectabilis (strain No. 5 / NBRC 109023) TaxID=1356009 RepID=V5G726_BYSSN|nr:conserved hypothetical protein [Paecilomyces variotii No. 5]